MQSIEEHFQMLINEQEPHNLYQPISYILSQGGKRIRPLLVLTSAKIFGGDIKNAIYPAAAFEMLHNFTLIHDDIMDQAPLRRGQTTIYKKWNGNIAILSGDALATMALQQLMRTPCSPQSKLQMIDVFSQTSLEVCEGQQYDLDFETQSEVSIEEYLQMIRLKTAVMLAGCLKAGAIYAGTSQHNQEHIYNFGIKVGIAFQLTDDILDLYSDSKVFGKVRGGDIQCNKKTFIYLLALRDGDETQKNDLLHYYSTDYNHEDKIQKVKTIFDTLSVKEKAEKYVHNYIEEAQKEISMLEITEESKQELYKISFELSNRIK